MTKTLLGLLLLLGLTGTIVACGPQEAQFQQEEEAGDDEVNQNPGNNPEEEGEENEQENEEDNEQEEGEAD